MAHERNAQMLSQAHRAAALRYAEYGYPVFPCVPNGKAPLTPRGFRDATMDASKIEAWWREYPTANVAIATAGLLVVDVDGAGNPWLSGDHERADDFAPGAVSLTPRGGKHFVFRQPPGRSWRNTAGRLAPKVDTRADGGYILAPPSVVDGKPYRWAETLELDEPPDHLPEPPAWLSDALDSLAGGAGVPRTDLPSGSNGIPAGQRNDALSRLAGAMRRVGMSGPEINVALQQVNTDRCAPALASSEVARIAWSIARYEPDQVSTAVAENHWQQDVDLSKVRPLSLKDLTEKFPALRPPVIHGLLREGETMNIIAASKAGKSWLVTDLALSIATGRPWLEIYACERGDVLIIDNELHQETSANRIPRVAQARGIPVGEVSEHVFVENLRGKLQDLFRLEPYFERFASGRFKVVILDAFYRFLPIRSDENDNGTMANLYNYLDRFAARLKCCFVLIHHTSKGNQAGKELTDVGAGAGAQSRATDTHLILRRHEEDDAVVLDAAVRSWPPVEPRCLRWTFPVWTPAEDLDPADLKQERPKKAKKAEEIQDQPWDAGRFAAAFVTGEPRTKACLIEAAEREGISEHKAGQLLKRAEGNRMVHRWHFGPRKPVGFSTEPQPELIADAGTKGDSPCV